MACALRLLRKECGTPCFFVVIWTIWECHNNVVFRGNQAKFCMALDSIKFRVTLCFKNHVYGTNVDLTLLIVDLNDRCVDKTSAKVNRCNVWTPPL